MSFGMFVTWVLVGALAGVLAGLVMKRDGYGLKNDVILGLVGSIGGSWLFRAVGLAPDAGIVAMTFVAALGAAIAIGAQRMIRPTERAGNEKGAVVRWGVSAALVAALGWMILGPAPQPAAIAAATVEEKIYSLTPATVTAKTGIVTSEMTSMKVTERVEKGSDRVTTPAKLTGILTLKNTSVNQSVRLVDGKIIYLDAQGQPIKLEDSRTEPTVKFSTSGGSDRLDPGQEAMQSLDVDFPAEALKGKTLKEIRLEFAYVPSPYRAEVMNFAVSVGASQ